MHIQFSKYQGTGNDFIMLNNLNGEYNELNIKQIQFLCDRKFGVGADGLIKLNSCASAAFEVEYFNADGTKSFCGNGARCSVRFAEQIGFTQTKLSFMAIDGLHSAVNHGDLIALDMMEVEKIEEIKTNEFVLNTGSPHYIKYVTNSLETNVVESGRKIRYSPQIKEE